MVVSRDREVGKMRRCSPKCTKLQLCSMSKSRDLMYRNLTTVNNTVEYRKFSKKVDCRYSHHTKSVVTLHEDKIC